MPNLLNCILNQQIQLLQVISGFNKIPDLEGGC